MSLTGEPDGPPAKSGLSLVDFSGGYVSALALLAGVWRARRDGVGCDCDIVAVRDRALAAHLRRDVGGVARARRRAAGGVRAPVDRAVPGVPDRRRLDHGRVREAEVLGGAVRRAGAAGRRALRGLRGPRGAPRGAAGAAPAAVRGADHRRGAGAPARACRAGAVNDVLGALDDPQVAARDGRSSGTSTRRSATCG